MSKAVITPIPNWWDDELWGEYTGLDKMKAIVLQLLKTTMLTNPGEVMPSFFGVGIKRILFEQDTPILRAELKARIEKQIAWYVPFVKLLSVQFSEQNDATQTLSISLVYYIMINSDVMGPYSTRFCEDCEEEGTDDGTDDGGGGYDWGRLPDQPFMAGPGPSEDTVIGSVNLVNVKISIS